MWMIEEIYNLQFTIYHILFLLENFIGQEGCVFYPNEPQWYLLIFTEQNSLLLKIVS